MNYYHRSLEEVWDKHHNCELVIYYKKFSNGDVVPGLYCKEYGIWIQWLDYAQADQYLLDGVEQTLEQPKKRKGHPVKWLEPNDLNI